MTDLPFNTFSCRFEFTHDYTAFVVAAHAQNIRIDTSELHHRKPPGAKYPSPDCYVEFKAQAPLEALREVLRNGDDLHVGLQTLREVPLEQNGLDRDHSL